MNSLQFFSQADSTYVQTHTKTDISFLTSCRGHAHLKTPLVVRALLFLIWIKVYGMKFLDGKNNEVIDTLILKMEESSKKQKYEAAANFRDQIESLRHTCEQSIVSANKGDVDIISIFIISETACVQVFNIRNGVNFGSETFFPEIDETINEISLEYGGKFLFFLMINSLFKNFSGSFSKTSCKVSFKGVAV